MPQRASLIIIVAILTHFCPTTTNETPKTDSSLEELVDTFVDYSNFSFYNRSDENSSKDTQLPDLGLSDNSQKSVVHRLKAELFMKYDKTVRPVRNVSRVSEIFVRMGILALLNVDETEGKIRAFVSTELYWLDEYLQWDPRKYDNLKLITIPLHLVWTPDLIIEIKRPLPEDRNLIRVDHTGAVTFLVMEVHEFWCPMHGEKFPFDDQNCRLTYGSYGYATNQLRWADKAMTSMTRDAHPEWYITEFTSDLETAAEFSQMQLVIRIKRKPAFYVITLMYPSSLITFLSILGMFTPGEASLNRVEKINVAMSTLLTLSVLLIVVAEILPKSQDDYPQIGKFFFTQIGTIVMHTVVAIFIMYINSLAQWKVEYPKWLRCWRTGKSSRTARRTEKRRTSITSASSSLLRAEPTDLPELRPLTMLNGRSTEFPSVDDNEETSQDVDGFMNQLNQKGQVPLNGGSPRRVHVDAPSVIQSLKDLQSTVIEWRKDTDSREGDAKEDEANLSRWNRFCFILDTFFLVVFLILQFALTVAFCSEDGKLIGLHHFASE